ncbi:MAG: NAD(P)/FAD-dependent oxidoreductase [Phycicoccus sp.]|nr:NAD(P)/FAD-dependent oxidoreductase [Phycicoccus sp.]
MNVRPATERATSDLTIVGAGPAGLFAAYYAGFRGLSVTLVDAQSHVGGQISALYPAKNIHDVAGFPNVSGAELVRRLLDQASVYGPQIVLGRQVVDLAHDEPGSDLAVTLDDGTTIPSHAVILATGVGGIRVRTLPVGDEWRGRGVAYLVPDPEAHRDEDVVIVGGGDSALDWALQLQPIARAVTVIHRRRTFRAHAASLSRAADVGIELLTECEVGAVRGDKRVTSVLIRNASGSRREIPADTVVGALGMISAPSPFAAWGIEVQDRHLPVDSTMSTNVSGVFAIGDVSTYRGKIALIATGFGEAATAVNNVAVRISPCEPLAPGHSTDEAVAPLESARRGVVTA